jgi:dipeptidyl aminopeptidase/acylaminoacyl peptidase
MRHAIPAQVREEALRDVPDLREIAFQTSDGLTLRGWFTPGKRRAAVVLVHGGWGDRTQLLPEARIMVRHGYGFLTYDSRANGESDGDLNTLGDRERRDVVAALDVASAQPEIDPKRIALLGFSIGGSSAALVAAADPRVSAAILAPVWTSLEDETKSKAGRLGPLSWGIQLWVMRSAGVDVDAVRPIDHIHEIAPRPVLFITGTNDQDTPPPVMQRMFDAAGSPKSLWIVEGAEHGTYAKTAPAEYEKRVVAFLDDTIGK